jgi:hypothetical protein
MTIAQNARTRWPLWVDIADRPAAGAHAGA